MTPKEKVQWLVDKYSYFEPNTAKQCALIAVDEIIQQWEVIDTYIADFGGELNQSLKFWQQVKQEIQAL
jgi:hypothetical protein